MQKLVTKLERRLERLKYALSLVPKRCEEESYYYGRIEELEFTIKCLKDDDNGGCN